MSRLGGRIYSIERGAIELRCFGTKCWVARRAYRNGLEMRYFDYTKAEVIEAEKRELNKYYGI